MTVGVTPRQASLLQGTAAVCEGRVGEGSIWAVLHRECHRLFPDELFADLYAQTGRRSVPPRIVAVVMVLQRLLGLSDREAVEAFTFDTRWKYACGGLDFDYPGFAHTVLVDMRERLRRSKRPERVFEVTVQAARQAGLVGARRVLDSTPLYDAVATMDTITLVRSAVRGLLRVADQALGAELRAVLASGDDYATTAKPRIDWDDAAACEALVDSRAKDARACLAVLDGLQLAPVVAEAAALLATVVGQDLEEGADGVLRIARKVARDRVISTVDPDARHGHKTAARGFDGYKGHISADPDSELVTATSVTVGNVGDAAAADQLLTELTDPAGPASAGDPTARPAPQPPHVQPPQAPAAGPPEQPAESSPTQPAAPAPEVYGDAAYGTGALLARLEAAGIDAHVKVPPPTAPGGRFAKDRFAIDLAGGTVTCPNQVTVPITWGASGGTARFGAACATCPLAPGCTSSPKGRAVWVGNYEAQLAAARARHADPARAADYRATRPKVERKLAHLMRRRHGGRRARVRGRDRVAADFALLAGAVNLARLAVLGLHWSAAGWAAAS